MIDRLKAELGDGDRFVVETLRPLPVQVNDFLVGSHPDGRLLIAEWSGDSVSTAGDETLPSQVIAVTNWFEQLRERMGGG